MDLNKSDLPNWCAWLLFGWVIFHIVVEIILEVHYCCTFYQLQGSKSNVRVHYLEPSTPTFIHRLTRLDFSEYNEVDKNKIPIKKKNPPVRLVNLTTN